MPLVRPIGGVGSLGLLLPTAPQGESPVQYGITNGVTTADPAATAEHTDGPGLTVALSAAHLSGVCRQAEEAGASALWAVDHLFWPCPMLECLHALTLAALATRDCTIGSCVVQVPLRSPAALAKQASSLQLLSGGRFVLGVGSGSHAGEYEAAGVDYSARGRLLDEGLAVLRRAWDSATGPGDPYRQLPSGPRVPVWIGGSSTAARRRAAKSGDGWVPLFLEPGQLAGAFVALRREAEDAGRDPGDVTPATVVPVHVGPAGTAAERGARWLSSLYSIPPKAFARHLVAGPAALCAAEIERYLDAGAHHIVVMVADDHPVEHFSALAGALAARTAPPPHQPVPAPQEVMA